jgi:molybdopterin/thiamine biosynthesis adenylyltransferase
MIQNKVHLRDLSANFYLEESHVKKYSRDRAVHRKMADLNPAVKLGILGEVYSDDSESEEESEELSETEENQEVTILVSIL